MRERERREGGRERERIRKVAKTITYGADRCSPARPQDWTSTPRLHPHPPLTGAGAVGSERPELPGREPKTTDAWPYPEEVESRKERGREGGELAFQHGVGITEGLNKVKVKVFIFTS